MTARFAAMAISLSGIAAATACGVLQASSDDDASDASTPDGLAPSIHCPAACRPAAPPEWTGPSAVFRGLLATGLPVCPDAYPKFDVGGHEGLDAATASCSCGAGTLVGQACTVKILPTADPSCTGIPNVSIDVGRNANVCFGVSQGFFIVSPPVLKPGACAFDASAIVPPLTFEAQSVACGMLGDPACPDRADCVSTPAPAAPFDRLCIHHDGEVDCPSADYAVRHVVYLDRTDTRACSTCSGDAGTTCGSTFELSGTCDEAGISEPTGVCNPAAGTGNVLRLSGLGPTTPPTCAAFEESTPLGEAHSLHPVTFCCDR
jgi:hypothetical protein